MALVNCLPPLHLCSLYLDVTCRSVPFLDNDVNGHPFPEKRGGRGRNRAEEMDSPADD